MDKKKLKKLLEVWGKEVGRWLICAVLPASVAYFSEFDAQWAIKILGLLRLADRLVHLGGKAIKSDGLMKGICRF